MNTRKTRNPFALAPAIAAGVCVLTASAATAGPGFSIPWSTIDGGGGTISGGSYTLSGTIGQPDAGATLTGGSYTLTGGFWSITGAGACAADFDGNGVINILDVVSFVTTWNAQGPGSDFNNDGFFNILDVVGFIQTWNLGCP